MKRRRSCPPIQTRSGSFAGFRFPPEAILLAVRWYLQFGCPIGTEEGASRRARHRGRPRDAVSVGTTVKAITGFSPDLITEVPHP